MEVFIPFTVLLYNMLNDQLVFTNHCHSVYTTKMIGSSSAKAVRDQAVAVPPTFLPTCLANRKRIMQQETSLTSALCVLHDL